MGTPGSQVLWLTFLAWIKRPWRFPAIFLWSVFSQGTGKPALFPTHSQRLNINDVLLRPTIEQLHRHCDGDTRTKLRFLEEPSHHHWCNLPETFFFFYPLPFSGTSLFQSCSIIHKSTIASTWLCRRSSKMLVNKQTPHNIFNFQHESNVVEWCFVLVWIVFIPLKRSGSHVNQPIAREFPVSRDSNRALRVHKLLCGLMWSQLKLKWEENTDASKARGWDACWYCYQLPVMQRIKHSDVFWCLHGNIIMSLTASKVPVISCIFHAN